MKKLFTLVYLFSLIIGGMTFSNDAFAMQAEWSAAAATNWPSCPTCDGNKLVNWSFEDKKSTNNNEPASWLTTGSSISFDRNADYKVCGNTGATFFGIGSFYQDVAEIYEGSVATLKIFGARHKTDANQRFELQFLNSSGDPIGTAFSAPIGNIIDNTNTMVMYTVTTDAAPSGTAKIRVKGSMTKADGWIKVDAACLTVTTCQTCTGNKLTNADFETTEVKSSVTVPTVWKTQKNSTTDLTIESSTLYKVCGSRGAAFSGNGYLYQEVAVAAGSNVTLTVWGARHEFDADQQFQLVFLNASNVVKGTFSVDIDKDVDDAPWGLRKYTINVPFAPDGTTKVSIRANMTKGGGWIKIDQACLTVVEQCGCDGNKLANASFESGTASWTPTTSPAPTFTSDLPAGAVGCGVKFGIVAGAGGIYQVFDVTKGSQVDLIIWGATTDATKTQKFKLTFYNGTSPMSANAQSVEVDAVFTKYLNRYSLSAIAPEGATKVYVEAVNTTAASGTTTKLYIDAACLKITTTTPLPVTLADFAVKKENTTALLSWSTTTERNSGEFEVQQSATGKSWNTLGSVLAKGESDGLVSYSFVHDKPENGNNFYRLKMVDLDNSFSYSRILTVSFDISDDVQVYPNPTVNYMKLSIGSEKIGIVKLYNTQGVKVLEGIPDASGRIDLSHLKTGNYIVKIESNTGVIRTRKVQIIK